jgi:RHS repeat-associated protein
VTTQTIGYTADGRIQTLNPGIQAPGGEFITELIYDWDGRLYAPWAGSQGELATYEYDGFGQRAVKRISSTTGEIYQYGQDGMLLDEANSLGAAQADYIYLDGRLIATLNPSTGALYFLHDDMLGTPQLATGSSQSVAWQATYQPFGQASVSGTITQNLRLPGQYFDLESGWNHNGFRNYLPDLGRYAEPDPLALQGLYPYARNSPLNYSDPSGLFTTRDEINQHRAIDIDPECGSSTGGACTLIHAALVFCACKETCGKWKANAELRIYGDLWVSGSRHTNTRGPSDHRAQLKQCGRF